MGAYKIMHGVDKVDKEKLSSHCPKTRARGHPMKGAPGRIRTDKRKSFFYPTRNSAVEFATSAGF